MKQSVSVFLLAPIGVGLLLVSCADKTPVKITYDAPPAPIIDNSLHALDAAVLNKDGKKLEGQTVSYAVQPNDLFEVSSSGGLRCLKAGDATLTLAAGSLRSSVPLKCRLPTEISLPQDLRLVVGDAPMELHARALGEGGRPLDDVTVQVTSSNPSVVAIEGSRAKAIGVGRARLQASLGGIVAVAPAEVDEKVVSERLSLADGAARSFNVKEGDYVVTVEVKPDVRVAQGVTVSWAGTNCDYRPESQAHQFDCRVLESATMTITNPKGIGVGARLTGTVSVLKVPPA